MSVNFTDDFNPPSDSDIFHCFDSTDGRYVLTTISLTYTLLVLPLSVFVLYLGFQRWRQQRSVSSAAVVTHSDFFNYTMAVIELIAAFGYTLYYCSSYADVPSMRSFSTIMVLFSWPGQTLFPNLICVERYLAVIHPITYRGLRQAGGVRIRNIITGCIWLICFVWVGIVMLLNFHSYYRYATATIILTLSLIIMAFCSLSVLRVLIRPRPGKVNRNRIQVDQSKQRAIRAILIIMAVLWLKFGGNVIIIVIKFSTQTIVKCLGDAFTFAFFLPSGVVLPLMYLHKAGKLPNCKHNTGPG